MDGRECHFGTNGLEVTIGGILRAPLLPHHQRGGQQVQFSFSLLPRFFSSLNPFSGFWRSVCSPRMIW